jgi:mannose-6-phosphate isomerase-like protein (cupin superfamily)
MILRNIYKEPLEGGLFEDERGIIADVFYSANINHITFISSKPFTRRGNHYHAETEQYMLITKGSLEYWYSERGKPEEAQFVTLHVGDLVLSGINEIHALKIGESGCDFIAFTSGKRGGRDYESDTFRVDNIIRD